MHTHVYVTHSPQKTIWPWTDSRTETNSTGPCMLWDINYSVDLIVATNPVANTKTI